MRAEGFIRPGIEVDPQQVLDYLRPDRWTRCASAEVHLHPASGCARRRPASATRAARRRGWAGMFNLPPSYLLIHRVTLGSIGVLCQLGATAPFREHGRAVAAGLRTGVTGQLRADGG